jgi:hypothetical protein
VLGYKQSFFFIVIIYLQLPLHYFERNAKDKMGPLINDHYVLLPFQPHILVEIGARLLFSTFNVTQNYMTSINYISEKVHEAFVGLWLEQGLCT